MKKSPPDDTYMIRCRKLGQQIQFSYCRQENTGLPCSRTLDCWFEHFQVAEYLLQALSPDEWRKSFEKPATPKIISLAELVEKARKLHEENR